MKTVLIKDTYHLLQVSFVPLRTQTHRHVSVFVFCLFTFTILHTCSHSFSIDFLNVMLIEPNTGEVQHATHADYQS